MKNTIAFICIWLILLFSPAAHAYDETYEKAVGYFKSRDFRNAVLHLEKYASGRPDPAAYYMLGYAFYELGNFDKSREYFDQVYLIDPEFSSDKVRLHSGHSRADNMLISEMLALSGINQQMEYFSAIMGRGIPSLQSGMSREKIRSDILPLINDSYRRAVVYPAVVEVFALRFQRPYAIAVLNWLRSPLGRKMAALDIGAADHLKKTDTAVYGRYYAKMDQDRRELIERLERVTRLTEFSAEVLSSSMFDMLKGMQSRLQAQSRLGTEEIDMLMETIRDDSVDGLSPDVMISLAYSCRDFTDSEIENAVRFYGSPEGSWFISTGIEAVSRALGRASKALGERIGRSIAMKETAL